LSPDLVPLWIQILSGLRLDSDPVWMASGFWNESRFRSFKDSIRTCLGCHLNSSTDRTAHRCRDRLSSFGARCHSDSFSVDVAVCPWLQWCSFPALLSFSLYASASFSQNISLRWIITLGTAKN